MATPLENRVLILPEPEEKIGGFAVPDSAKPKPIKGRVVTVGPGVREISNGQIITLPMICKEGDTVIYSKYGGTDIEIEGVTYVVMKESDVLAIL